MSAPASSRYSCDAPTLWLAIVSMALRRALMRSAAPSLGFATFGVVPCAPRPGVAKSVPAMVSSLGGSGGPFAALAPQAKLVILHNSQRDQQRETDIRIGEVPAGELLDAPEAVGGRVAVDPERGRRLTDAATLQVGSERRE